MTFDYDDKGKIYTDVVSKKAVPAVVQTTKQLIRGNVHVRQDELDRDELFLAVTDASVVNLDGQILHQARFMAVRRAQIVWVMPAQDVEEVDEL